MGKIQVQATFSIHEGRLADFKAAAERAVTAVRAQDTETEQYDWFFNADESVCVVRETYASSQAVLDHISHVESILGDLVAAGDMKLEIYGEPSEDLSKVGEAFGQVVYKPFLSL